MEQEAALVRAFPSSSAGLPHDKYVCVYPYPKGTVCVKLPPDSMDHFT
jgi:chlorite dismutase